MRYGSSWMSSQDSTTISRISKVFLTLKSNSCDYIIRGERKACSRLTHYPLDEKEHSKLMWSNLYFNCWHRTPNFDTFQFFYALNFALNDNWPTLASVIFYWKSESEMLLVVRSPSLEVILARRVDRNLIIPFALNLHWHMLIKLRPTCRDLWLGLLGENLSSCATADYRARAATTLITKPQH